jgi:hypothetical protein
MAADSNETFVDVEVREGIPRTEKIFCAFVTGTRERQRAFFMPVEMRFQLIRPEDLARLDLPPNSANIMLATDAAGEGINLQFAWIMVNYDIPWNPAARWTPLFV